MAAVNLRIKFGDAEFSAEGEEVWVGEQLAKFIAHLSKAPASSGASKDAADGSRASDRKVSDGATAQDYVTKALGTFLREKSATENQTKKFLAAAAWLQAKGKGRLKTGDVSRALRENNQTRLGNASQCLANNVGQGYCERDGSEFFVTDEGSLSL